MAPGAAAARPGRGQEVRSLPHIAVCVVVTLVSTTLTGCSVKLAERDAAADGAGSAGLVTHVEASASTVPPPLIVPAPAPAPVPAPLPPQPTLAPGMPPGLLAVTMEPTVAPPTTTTLPATETITTTSATTTSATSVTRTRTLTRSSSITTTTTALATTSTKKPKDAAFSCDTNDIITDAVLLDRKGFCLDDATFKDCPHKILGTWPNTKFQNVTTLRLFKPWDNAWGSEYLRRKAWFKLMDWVKKNNAKVLMGVEVTCDSLSDDEMWLWNIELMKMLGKEHIMGVAIGNEMDIFRDSRGSMDTACNPALWNGLYWKTLQSRVKDLDLNGFIDTKVTVVWAMSILGAVETPFKEDTVAKANTLVTKAYRKWGRRWAWSFNTYTIWDRSLWPTSKDDCAETVKKAVSIRPIRSILRELRRRIKMITGGDDDPLWIGETGWSSPAPRSIIEQLDFCPEFWSTPTLMRAYRNFLSWDLSIGDGLTGPDHAFYFTMRDSNRVGIPETFGLMSSCENRSCKSQISGTHSTLLRNYVL